ncbi:hypothetical protein HJFPF1_01421 [Paramyrothecium foliicola]|nr:hypothetical protein HJFPF1_01421 [Paramyrothecium foliicola]
MRVQRRLAVSIPIPLALPPAAVTAALHTVTSVIRQFHTISQFEAATVQPEIPTDDSFFNADDPLCAFRIYEVIHLAPGLTKDVTYLAYFQPLSNGLRCRADGTAGTITWMEFCVRPRRLAGSPEGSTSTPSTVTEADEYELSEALLVEANSLMMPTVLQATMQSHTGLCNRILNEVLGSFPGLLDDSPQESHRWRGH